MREVDKVRISPSNPDYPEINRLQTLIGVAINPHIHPFLHPGFEEFHTPEPEKRARIETLKAFQGELLDFNRMPFNEALMKIPNRRI